MSKKVVVIGGGVAGLSAGIYSALAGFETHVYEKNSVAGGNCSGWRRGDYFIDNCIHWLTGTVPNTFQNDLWREVGVITDESSFIEREAFYSSEHNGQILTLWRDVDRAEREMLALSPEDEIEIKKFFKYVRFSQSLQKPKDKDNSPTVIETVTDIAQIINPIQLLQGITEYVGLSLETLANKFSHPLIKKLITDFMAKEYEAYWLVMAYSFFVAGNGDLPEGGSLSIPRAMTKKLDELGGKLHMGNEVVKIVIDSTKYLSPTTVFNSRDMRVNTLKEMITHNAIGVLMANGQFVEADYIICAAGIDHTFNTLLGSRKYMPRRIKSLLKNKKEHHIYSSYQVAFAVDGLLEEIPDTLSFDCMPIDVGRRSVNRITIKNYRLYGDYIAPAGKTVIQCSIVQYKEDFSFWQKMHGNKVRYAQAKKNIADAVLSRVISKYPQYEGRITYLDSWTPMTYYLRNNCEYGAYMRYITTVSSTTAFLPTSIQGLGNVFLAGHSLLYPGGVPNATYSGKIAVEKITKLEGKLAEKEITIKS